MKNKLSLIQSLAAVSMAAIVSTVINLLLFFAFEFAGIISNEYLINGKIPMAYPPIIIMTIVPCILAGFVFYLFERYSENGFKIFTILTFILLGLSFLNPFLGIPGVPLGYALSLNLMHVVVAVSLLYFLRKEIQKRAI